MPEGVQAETMIFVPSRKGRWKKGTRVLPDCKPQLYFTTSDAKTAHGTAILRGTKPAGGIGLVLVRRLGFEDVVRGKLDDVAMFESVN
jgi:hypothetical protein